MTSITKPLITEPAEAIVKLKKLCNEYPDAPFVFLFLHEGFFDNLADIINHNKLDQFWKSIWQSDEIAKFFNKILIFVGITLKNPFDDSFTKSVIKWIHEYDPKIIIPTNHYDLFMRVEFRDLLEKVLDKKN